MTADAAGGGLVDASTARRREAVGLLYGPAHILVHGNPPFVERFGRDGLGLPVAEGVPDLPRQAVELFDAVLESGRPLARWVVVGGRRCRLTAAPRSVLPTGEVYGVAFRLAGAAA